MTMIAKKVKCDFPGCAAFSSFKDKEWKRIVWTPRDWEVLLCLPAVGNLMAIGDAFMSEEAHLCPQHYQAIFKMPK